MLCVDEAERGRVEQGEGTPRVEDPVARAAAQGLLDALRAVEIDARSGGEMPRSTLTATHLIN